MSFLIQFFWESVCGGNAEEIASIIICLHGSFNQKVLFFFCKEKDNKVGFRVLSMYRYDFDIDFEECGNIK